MKIANKEFGLDTDDITAYVVCVVTGAISIVFKNGHEMEIKDNGEVLELLVDEFGSK